MGKSITDQHAEYGVVRRVISFLHIDDKMRRPGVEPGSTAWKAAMLTVIPPTLFFSSADRIYIIVCNPFSYSLLVT